MKRPVDRSFYRSLGSVALPIALQGVVSSSLTLVDNLMVGRLGEAALSSAGLAVQIFHLNWMVFFGFCAGCSTFVTQFWGVRDLKSIRKVAGLAVLTCLSVGLLFFLTASLAPRWIMSLFTHETLALDLGSTYIRAAAPSFLFLAVTMPLAMTLRATQQAQIPLWVSSSAFVLNTALNYCLIFGRLGFPELGVRGAALATMIARLAECLLMCGVVFGGRNVIAGPLKEFFSFSRAFALRVYRNATSTTLNEGLWATADAAYNAAYGRLGITAYASVQASSTIMNLFAYSAFSLGDAALILVGERLGQGDEEGAWERADRLLRISLVVGLVLGLILALASGFFIGFFDLTAGGALLAGRLLLLKGLFFPLSMYTVTQVTGTLRAGGDTRFAMFCEVGTMWLVGVPLAFLGALYFRLPVYSVYLLTQAESLIKALILRNRYRSGRWVRNVIGDMEGG